MIQHAQFTGVLLGILKKRIEEDKLQLPILSSTADIIMHASGDTMADLGLWTRIVDKDPLLGLLILKTDKSEGAGARGSIPESIPQSCERLGAKRIKTMLTELIKTRVFNSRVQGAPQLLSGMCEHSLAVALLAQDVAGLTNCPDPDTAYVAGLLHEIASIITCIFLFEFEKSLYTKPMSTKPDWLSLDGFTNIITNLSPEISNTIAMRWNLSDQVRKSIAGIVDYDISDRISIVNIVHFSNALAQRLGLSSMNSNSEEIDALIMIGNSILGLEKEIIERLSRQIKQRVAATD